MAKHERNQGAILLRLKNTIAQLSVIRNYTPTDPSNSLTALRAFVAAIEAAQEATFYQEGLYFAAIDARRAAFYEDKYGLTKILKYIRATVESTYGNTATQTQRIAAHIQKMRGKRIGKKAAAAEATATEQLQSQDSDSTEPQEATSKKNSVSHASFAALLCDFRDLLSKLRSIQYEPCTTELQLSSLNLLATKLDQLNQDAETNSALLKQKRTVRNALFLEIMPRIIRIKRYICMAFGADSPEYICIVKN